MKLQDFPHNSTIPLPARGSWPEAHHYFEPDHLKAVVAAWHAGRPLLIKGKPGVGKSQLARAVAEHLDMQFISLVIQPRSEYQDLLWEYDAVARLADAQIYAAAGEKDIHSKLAQQHYIKPGPLWWALDPISAEAQNHREDGSEKGPDPRLMPTGFAQKGNVVLIDEIDKADIDLPNGLLELLGNQSFSTPFGGTVESCFEHQPLVIITTNEDRELPAAFVRRCLVLTMALPATEDEAAFDAALRQYAQAHYPGSVQEPEDKQETSIADQAARLLREERLAAEKAQLPAPGPAEYLDLLRVVHRMEPDDAQAQSRVLEEMAQFVLRKHSTV